MGPSGPRPSDGPPGMHQRPQPPFGNMRGNSMPSTPSGKRPQDSRGSISSVPPKRFVNKIYAIQELHR